MVRSGIHLSQARVSRSHGRMDRAVILLILEPEIAKDPVMRDFIQEEISDARVGGSTVRRGRD